MKPNIRLLYITFIISLCSPFSVALAKPVKSKPGFATPAFKKILIVMFENCDYKRALKQPFFAKFAHEGALLTDFMAESHPSQGNYIALVAGNEYGGQYDGNVVIHHKNIGDLLSKKGLSWKNYAEDFPGKCYLKARDGRYARKHVPFISFADVEKNAKNCSHVVNAIQWQKDLAANTLPTYSFYTPNLNDDGHDTGPAYASKWFAKFMANLKKYPKAMKGLLIVATFDESAGSTRNHIYTALYGAGIKPGSRTNLRYNHYSILRTLEDHWHLGTLATGDAKATPIQGVWKN